MCKCTIWMSFSEHFQSMTSGSMLADQRWGRPESCGRWHVPASSLGGGGWRLVVINVSALSFCRWLLIETPRWMLKTKFSAAGTEGQTEADTGCVTGCMFRHTVLLRSLLFWEL